MEALKDNLLTPYQVGENDVVAAYDEEEAIEVLCLYTGCNHTNEFDKSVDVTDLTKNLDEMLKDEDGNDLNTLRAWVEELTEPQYMYGWE